MTTAARARYKGRRFPAEIIGHAVWLYFRFPLGLRMVEELLAARGIIVSHETVRQWARKFGQRFANQIRRRLPRVGDKWRHRQLIRPSRDKARRLGGVSCGLDHSGNAADFGPDPECLRPGGSVLGGSGVIAAAEVEEIINLIVG